MVQVQIENGIYSFKLGDILRERGISINKLMRDTNTDFKVLKRLINGDSARIDIGVLARLCNYLNCSVSDIVEYHSAFKYYSNFLYPSSKSLKTKALIPTLFAPSTLISKSSINRHSLAFNPYLSNNFK